jgi:hypothetical protein
MAARQRNPVNQKSNNMNANDKRTDLTPLKENELGQIEGGFAEIPAIAASESDQINMICGPTNICLGYTTTNAS